MIDLLNYLWDSGFFVRIQSSGGIIFGAVVISTLIMERVSRKYKPWTALLNAVGKKINAELSEDIKKTQQNLEKFQKEFHNHELEYMRGEILKFAGECRKGEEHTKEDFDRIIRIHDQYAIFIKEHDLKNGQVDEAYKIISRIYQKCWENQTFLA